MSIFSPIGSAWRFVRRHLWKFLLGAAALVVVLIVVAVSQPKQATYVTAVAVRGDLLQTVEAVGTVVSEKDLELQFPTTDIVAKVDVKEGDHVKAGQRLASLRSGSLSASIASASANVQSAKAALQALTEGARPEDIAIAEASVANKRAALDAARQTSLSAEANLKTSQQKLTVLKSEASTGLSGQVTTANSSISQYIASAKTALNATAGVFNANDIQDAIVKNPSGEYDSIRANRASADSALSLLQSSAMNASDYQTALKNLEAARTAVGQAADNVSRSYDFISVLPLTSYFTNTSRETAKSSIATQKTSVQAAFSALDSAAKGLRDASASYDTRIATEQSNITSLQGTLDRAKADISTYQTSLQIEEAQLALKKAPARQTDVDSAQARVRQAQADLARAAAQFNDTVLTAPVDGVVTQVNVKAGEMRPLSGPSITLLGNTPYRIEMYVSEIDIPKVQVTQSGSIELDAFRGSPIPLRVGEIDPGATDRDGVPKYRVKLDFVAPKDALKIGMTGDAEIVTGAHKDVVSVPLRAVIERDGAKIVRVLKPDGKTVEERTVTTGLDGSNGDIEVTGIQAGETVVVLVK
ncbi:MAG TPA: efflux RND transporter periplasmic adaptor subunit [Candidatus Peribacteria bacterium]|nr:efflux RND transporter periplasmic adaptor subunit [Candidatus Peribacteria bacterium]